MGTAAQLRRAIAAAVLAGSIACHHQVEVARSNWASVDSGDRIEVFIRDGAMLELTGFVFTPKDLEAARGVYISPTGTGTRRTTIRTPLRFPLDSIAYVTIKRLDKPMTVLAVAAATTATWVLLRDPGSSTPEPNPGHPPRLPPGSTSCPYIYSFDGEKYVFDGETYASAFGRGFERTDLDNLDHLRPVNGRYRLQLANERNETEYTDALTLLVTDHPAGTRVFPDNDGVAHVVGSGAESASRREYVVNSSGAARARIEFAFARPSTRRAALVVTLRNAPLAPFIVERIFGLLGSDVYAWYDSMAVNAESRDKLGTAIQSDIALEVSVQTADGWSKAAAITTVGPAINKSVVVPVDVPSAPGDSVRVRLESSPLLWLVDKVELVSYEGVADGVTVLPQRATTADSVDVTALLSNVDKRYHVSLTGDRTTMEFVAPPVRQGMTRSVLARTRGHYYFAPNDKAVPQRALVSRLMTDRVFAQQYWAFEWLKTGERK